MLPRTPPKRGRRKSDHTTLIEEDEDFLEYDSEDEESLTSTDTMTTTPQVALQTTEGNIATASPSTTELASDSDDDDEQPDEISLDREMELTFKRLSPSDVKVADDFKDWVISLDGGFRSMATATL